MRLKKFELGILAFLYFKHKISLKMIKIWIEMLVKQNVIFFAMSKCLFFYTLLVKLTPGRVCVSRLFQINLFVSIGLKFSDAA